MRERPLNGLVLLNIHPEIIIRKEEVVDVYAYKHPKRILVVIILLIIYLKNLFY